MPLRERRTTDANVNEQNSLSSTGKSPEVDVPPHGIMLLPMYAAFGVIASFAFGREPGTLPHTETLLFDELMWPAVVTCAFVVCYSLFDTLGVGRARARCRHLDATAHLMSPAKPVPEELALALRAHANQVEQFPSFVAALWTFSFFVSGFGGGVLGGLWVVLRQRYSSVYRNSAGVGMADKGLGNFTLPCYFAMNAMAMGVVVHILRFVVASKLNQ
mmetsp:Transcript_4206/g.13263  ORF Transcript_4206/g.13263 Transcript_4206/m.13263 type:complete len:217 (-) Transcript_4206:308-958(-)